MQQTEGATILVVNDSADQLDLIKYLLEQENYQILTALDGAEGLEIASRIFPKLIISDVRMPVMNGIEMCRRIREIPKLAAVPLLLVSALELDSRSVVEGLEAGADDYLKIPFDYNQLIAKAARLLDRRRAQELVERSENYYRALIENASDLISLIKDDGTMAYQSPSLKRILGYDPEDLEGKNVFEFLHPEDTDDARRAFTDVIENLNELVKVEIRFRHRNGEWRNLICTLTNLLHNPDINAIISNGVDITERKRAEEALRKSEEQFRQSQRLESIGRLAGGVAHDFNNLLTAINGYSDLALRQLTENDPLRPNLEEIKRAGDRAASLTRQLLAFSRKQVLKPEIINLNTIIPELEKMLQRLIGEHIELRVVAYSGLKNIKADPGQIEQVIMNLVLNACDAMPRGGKLTIETANVHLDEFYADGHLDVAPGDYVMLAVNDNGVGMDAETQQQIFEPFFTTKELGKGTGLGLSTVYGIVAQSGGTIWVYSEIGKGSTFKVYFPRADETVEQIENPDAAADFQKGTETILLVEDEDIVRNLSCQVLQSCGYTVIEASNGVEALKVCGSGSLKIDLLITDVVMPLMGGRELAEKLTLIYPKMHVLFTSGYTDDAVVRHGIIEAGTNFIQKPFALDALTRKVRKLLDAPKGNDLFFHPSR